MKAVRMTKRSSKLKRMLAEKYPPSEPCSCEICLGYCARPGWWTVDEAKCALDAGYGKRMMLEVAPELTFAVLSPAFKGCEGSVATNQFAHNGCTFLTEKRCELFGTAHQPLECRFCHHERQGQGMKCHTALEKDWKSPVGQTLVEQWMHQFGLKLPLFTFEIVSDRHTTKRSNDDRNATHCG